MPPPLGETNAIIKNIGTKISEIIPYITADILPNWIGLNLLIRRNFDFEFSSF